MREILEEKSAVPEERRATEYLANERTFLAWIRTSVALISLGFVVAKFGVWLRELATARIGSTGDLQSVGASVPMGISLIILGALFAVLAAWRYHTVNHRIERGEVKADRWLVIFVTAAIVVLALIMVMFMLLTIEHL